MRDLAGGRWYEPADLGFDSLVIAAATTAVGRVVPWCQAFEFSRAVIFFEIVVGPSADFTLQAGAVDIDGQSALISPSLNLVANMTTSSAVIFSGNADTPRAANGTVVLTPLPIVVGTPYIQFRIPNNDVVNAGTVSLRAFLGK